MELYLFTHFGPNTFTDKEWGLGDEPENVFNPSNLNCEQWCKIAKAAGAKGQVTVQVMINDNGDVTSAYALSGDQLLRDAAEVAGRAAKFRPTRPNSKLPGRYGKLVYDFKL
jgi:TonB family protein